MSKRQFTSYLKKFIAIKNNFANVIHKLTEYLNIYQVQPLHNTIVYQNLIYVVSTESTPDKHTLLDCLF